MYLYYNPWVCLSRKTQVAKCISNCCVSSLVKTSISTKISLLRLSPMQRFKTRQPSAVKIQNFLLPCDSSQQGEHVQLFLLACFKQWL